MIGLLKVWGAATSFCLVAALLFGSAAQPFAQAAPTLNAACDRGGVLSAAGIGPLRIGMTIDSLSRTCRIIDRRYVSEYMTTRYSVRVGGDTLTVWEANGRVDWIQTTSPIHRTRDSLGVGSSVTRLLMLPDIAGGPGEGSDAYVVYPTSGEHCGVSFWLDPKASEIMGRTKGDVPRALGMRGGDGFVVEIHIRGACPRRPVH